MKECKFCATKLVDDAKFCKACGKRLDGMKICPSCGGEIDETSIYCPDCGERIDGKKVCLKCGAVIEKSVAFCPTCGEPNGAVVNTANKPNKPIHNKNTANDGSFKKKLFDILSNSFALAAMFFALLGSILVGKNHSGKQTLFLMELFGEAHYSISIGYIVAVLATLIVLLTTVITFALKRKSVVKFGLLSVAIFFFSVAMVNSSNISIGKDYMELSGGTIALVVISIIFLVAANVIYELNKIMAKEDSVVLAVFKNLTTIFLPLAVLGFGFTVATIEANNTDFSFGIMALIKKYDGLADLNMMTFFIGIGLAILAVIFKVSFKNPSAAMGVTIGAFLFEIGEIVSGMFAASRYAGNLSSDLKVDTVTYNAGVGLILGAVLTLICIGVLIAEKVILKKANKAKKGKNI